MVLLNDLLGHLSTKQLSPWPNEDPLVARQTFALQEKPCGKLAKELQWKGFHSDNQ